MHKDLQQGGNNGHQGGDNGQQGGNDGQDVDKTVDILKKLCKKFNRVFDGPFKFLEKLPFFKTILRQIKAQIPEQFGNVIPQIIKAIKNGQRVHIHITKKFKNGKFVVKLSTLFLAYS